MAHVNAYIFSRYLLIIISNINLLGIFISFLKFVYVSLYVIFQYHFRSLFSLSLRIHIYYLYIQVLLFFFSAIFFLHLPLLILHTPPPPPLHLTPPPPHLSPPDLKHVSHFYVGLRCYWHPKWKPGNERFRTTLRVNVNIVNYIHHTEIGTWPSAHEGNTRRVKIVKS